ncbi:universal stress protein [Brachybacterium sp. 107]|uniref:universal stress protein n=1 Tax=Brachybacterium sp. 107 TaxID=3457736 RepID=UPI0040346FF2
MHDEELTLDSPVPYDPESRQLGVLVGYDGSEQSIQALHYAARAAQRLGTTLSVVTAYTVPVMIYPNMASFPPEPDDVASQAAAEMLLEEATPHLRGYPGKVQLRTEHGDAAGVMVRLSGQARLAVVGARGRGGFLGLLLGSVSSALPAHSHCPTVVVPRQYEIGQSEGAARFAPVADDAPVVAGVDDSPRSQAVIALAAEAAQGRGAPLHLLMVMPAPETWGGMYASMLPAEVLIERKRAALAADLEETAAKVRTQFPEITVTSEVLLSDPATELVQRSADAQLTVVGTRGHGRVAGTLMGSVSRSVLHRATGPVLVVPDLDPERITAGSHRPR